MPDPVAVRVVLTEPELQRLQVWAHRGQGPLGIRSRIVLAAAAGLTNTEIAGQLGVRRATAGLWRGRFAERRLDGLRDAPRPGRPRTIADEKVQEVVTRTKEAMPPNGAPWRTRSLAAELGLSQSAVSRIWRQFGLAPQQRPRT